MEMLRIKMHVILAVDSTAFDAVKVAGYFAPMHVIKRVRLRNYFNY